jgi:hypothetical protein
MWQIFTGYAVGTAIVIAISLASSVASSAASRHTQGAKPVSASAHPSRYYDYAPGQLGERKNPTLPDAGQFGPPDPASCGGFHC